jgi:hypothetical protein
MKNGKIINGYNSTHINRELRELPAKLSIQDELIKIYKFSNPLIKQYISYLAKTVNFIKKASLIP